MEGKKWYYVKDKDQFGPVPQEELRELFRSKVLEKETPVWAFGLKKWDEAYRVEEFKDLFLEFQPPITTEIEEKVELSKVQEFHPWRRFFAKFLDFSILSIIFYLVFFNIGIKPDFIGSDILYLLIFSIVEALLISVFGTTFGKFLFNIKVRDKYGNFLSLSQSIRRSYLCYIYGLFLGVPLVYIIAGVMSYRNLKRNRTTVWDSKTDSVVVYKKTNIFKVSIASLIMICLVILVILGFYQQMYGIV